MLQRLEVLAVVSQFVRLPRFPLAEAPWRVRALLWLRRDPTRLKPERC